MNSALVLSAYFAMLLSPCFVAQWGDLLSFRWMRALARRRRTHRAESFLVSFREERYVMAVALEASFAAANSDFAEAPEPFLLPKRSIAMDTPAFLEARQRVAARLTQLAVAQKLRAAAQASEKIVAIPPDIIAPTVAALSAHVRPRKPVPVPVYQPTELAVAAASEVFAGDATPLPEIAVVSQVAEIVFVEAASVPIQSPQRAHHGIEAVPSRQRKDESSGSLEVAA